MAPPQRNGGNQGGSAEGAPNRPWHNPNRVDTSDPATVSARLFVSNLGPNFTGETLTAHFSQYGPVKGVSISKANNFGFIQFESEEGVTACMDQGGKTAVIEGHNIEVKKAKIKGSKGEEGGRGAPPKGRKRGRDGEERRPPPGARDYYGGDDFYRAEPPRRSPPPPADPYYAAPYYPRPAYAAPPPEERLNDIEIVVLNKMQRAYAESIEVLLKRLHLQVDILFPPPGVTVTRVLGDLSARKVLYAVTVTEDNETHRSLTLNILHGQPQEHRNMPIDDALVLVQRDYAAYLKQKTTPALAAGPPPAHIRLLLHDALEGRALPSADYDTLIAFLRGKQAEHAKGRRSPPYAAPYDDRRPPAYDRADYPPRPAADYPSLARRPADDYPPPRRAQDDYPSTRRSEDYPPPRRAEVDYPPPRRSETDYPPPRRSETDYPPPRRAATDYPPPARRSAPEDAAAKPVMYPGYNYGANASPAKPAAPATTAAPAPATDAGFKQAQSSMASLLASAGTFPPASYSLPPPQSGASAYGAPPPSLPPPVPAPAAVPPPSSAPSPYAYPGWN